MPFFATSPSACCLTTTENDFSVGRFLPWNEVLQLATTEKRFRHRKLYSLLQVLDNDQREAKWLVLYYFVYTLLCFCVCHLLEISAEQVSIYIHLISVFTRGCLPTVTV